MNIHKSTSRGKSTKASTCASASTCESTCTSASTSKGNGMVNIRFIAFAMPVLALLAFGLARAIGTTAPAPRYEIVISMPYSDYIRNTDTNYYKQWLEDQTGLSIKFNIIYESLSPVI